MTLPSPDIVLSREYMLIIRDSLLKMVDAYERILSISPRTSELRQMAKNPPPQYHVELEYNRASEKGE